MWCWKNQKSTRRELHYKHSTNLWRSSSMSNFTSNELHTLWAFKTVQFVFLFSCCSSWSIGCRCLPAFIFLWIGWESTGDAVSWFFFALYNHVNFFDCHDQDNYVIMQSKFSFNNHFPFNYWQRISMNNFYTSSWSL